MALNKVLSSTDYLWDTKVASLEATGKVQADVLEATTSVSTGSIECKSIGADNGDINVLTGISASFQAVKASGLLANEKHTIYRDASAKYALNIVQPVGFADNPQDLTAEFELKGVYEGAVEREMLCIRGNFSIDALLAAAAANVEYTMTLTDASLTALFVNADVVYKKGYGVGANGAGADSSYLTDVDASVQGQVVLTFANITHTQTPQGSPIVHSFELHLAQPVPP